MVTGGTGHIALAVGEALVELGAATSVLDLDPEACEERVATLSRPDQAQGYAIPCDLGDESATRAATEKAIDQMGGLDILVHCAAFGGTTQFPGWAVPFEEQTVEAWEYIKTATGKTVRALNQTTIKATLETLGCL